MADEHICEKCKITKVKKPDDDLFGHVAIAGVYDYTVDEKGHYHQSSSKFRIIEKQKKFICDKCVKEARKSEFILLGVFYGLVAIILLTTLILRKYTEIKFPLGIGMAGTGIYFYMRKSSLDIRDNLLKELVDPGENSVLTRKNIERQEV